MIKDLIIVDDVFKDPDSMVDLANSLPFYRRHDHPEVESRLSNWNAWRTCNLLKDQQRMQVATERISDAVQSTILHGSVPYERRFEFNWNGSAYFHRIDEDRNLGNETLHKDAAAYAGIVYLTKDPKPNSGTIIYIDDQPYEIENRYNRLIMYRADYIHRPAGGFGVGESSRLTLLMFFNSITFTMKV